MEQVYNGGGSASRRYHRLPNTKLSVEHRLPALSSWSLASHRPLNITGYYHYPWLTSRIVSKFLVLKAPHSKVLCILLGENSNQQYHPAVSPAIYNNEYSARTYPLVHQWHRCYGSDQ